MKLIKVLSTIVFILTAIIYARDIKPIVTINTSGIVSDFVEDNGFLYVATDSGIVDIIDLSKEKIVKKIKLKPLTTAQGDVIPARIHAIDRYKGKTLLVSSDVNAYRNVWIDDGIELKKVIDSSKHLMPKSAFFINENRILLGSFGSDITLYDNSDNTQLYNSHISESTMGGMVLTEDKRRMVVSDESGNVRLIDINSSKVIKTFSSEHVDNIYRVAYANGIIVTAGQDRRIGVYAKNGTAYHLKSNFLVYAVGLSPSGDRALFSSGEEHYLQLFNTKTKKIGNRLVGHYAIPNKILFINEDSVISSGDEERIFFWNLKKK